MAKSEIRSPLPGTFYHRSAPDQPPFMEPGKQVMVGDTLGLIEVMKSFHPVAAEVDGVFTAYLVNSDEAVMPGQVLLEIES